jgi:RNA polymerase sigma factor (sigma-70 family)
MMTSSMIPTAAPNDADLVAESLSGNRDAFGQIVSRYQRLVCSLAYSATGSLSQSEDLAQDIFVTAWKQLRDLREPERLRAWLCGIARNLINNFLRREQHEPSHRAQPLEDISASHSPEPLPVDKTISKEEAELLWRSLEKIPETYREPLILFYREHQSIGTVAANLDLSEDAVKQRLSRGRKLLQEQFLAFVEGALAQTSPGRQFTLGVLAALPAATFAGKAAALGAVAKGGAAAKSAGMLGLFSAILSPVLIIFGGYANYRMSLDEAETEEERHRIKEVFGAALKIALLISVIVAVPVSWLIRGASPTDFWTLLFSQFIVIYFLTLAVFVFKTMNSRRRYLAGILARQYAGNYPPAAYEYRSRWTLFGLPLIHVRLGDRFDIVRGPVKAWIAIGSCYSVGVLFASGGLAIAPVSFGGIAIGLVPLGAMSVGMISIGAICVGVWVYGGLAFGWQICCGIGAARNAAMGGIVFARDFALGGITHAAQANNDIAQKFFDRNLFFRISRIASQHNFLTMLVWIIPLLLQSRVVTRARRRREQAAAPITTNHIHE